LHARLSSSISLNTFNHEDTKGGRCLKKHRARPVINCRKSQFVFVLPVFLLGIGQEPLPQQQDSLLSMPLQQAWAFLPFFFFLQQDMSALQQSFMSQQLAEFWLEFCGFSARAPAETARAVAQAKVIKSTLTFLMIVAPKIKELLMQFRKSALMTVNVLSPFSCAGTPLD
jgi:hypothetical protein